MREGVYPLNLRRMWVSLATSKKGWSVLIAQKHGQPRTYHMALGTSSLLASLEVHPPGYCSSSSGAVADGSDGLPHL